MAVPIVMPKLGMTMREGTVIEWPVAILEHVDKGRTLLIIESEKAEVEVEAIASGYFRHIYVEAGQTVPCGTLLAALTDTPDEEFDREAFRVAHDRPEPAPAAAKQPAVGVPAEPTRSDRGGRRASVTPAARKRARELGLDDDAVSRVPGTGPGGRVTREDVELWVKQRESRVEVAEGVCLEVAAQGQGDTVLLLPGFGIDISVFARQIPALSESYRVLGVNPRGVGLSDAPETECYEVAVAAADAAAAAGGPVHLLGTSLGAAAALEMALADPGTVRSLALVTPFARAGARLLAVLDAWCALAAEVQPETLARALLPWLFSSRHLADAGRRQRTLRGLAESLARVPAATLPRAAAGLRRWSETWERPDTRKAQLSALAVPTCVIAAGGDLLTPEAATLAEAIPGARCVTIPEAGHAVGLEAPDPVNQALLAHLASVR